MSISVIIPTADRASSLALTLESLCRQSVRAAQFESLVVDNGSGDATLAVVEKLVRCFPRHRIRYIKEPVPGLLSGRHRGALEAESELLAFIDDDVDVARRWVGVLLDSFGDPLVHIVGGRSLPRYEVDPPCWLEAFWSQLPHGGRMCVCLSLIEIGENRRVIDANYVWGLNLAIRRETLFELGGFHPDCIPPELQRFQGDGETGLTTRANEMGLQALYEPAATVWHRIPRTRLTLDYFRRRAFYEGVAISYSAIRRRGDVSRESWETRYLLANSFSGLLEKEAIQNLDLRSLIAVVGSSRRERTTLKVKRAMRTAFVKGFEFHHREASRDPTLLEWILRKDYWDYRLDVNRPRVGK